MALIAGSGVGELMSPNAKELRSWGSKIGARIGRGEFASIARDVRDQSLAKWESETASARQWEIWMANAVLPHEKVVI